MDATVGHVLMKGAWTGGYNRTSRLEEIIKTGNRRRGRFFAALVSYSPQLLAVLSGHGLLNYGVIQSADPLLLRSTHPSVFLPATMNDLQYLQERQRRAILTGTGLYAGRSGLEVWIWEAWLCNHLIAIRSDNVVSGGILRRYVSGPFYYKKQYLNLHQGGVQQLPLGRHQ